MQRAAGEREGAATDIISERGDAGVDRINRMTDGGADNSGVESVEAALGIFDQRCLQIR